MNAAPEIEETRSPKGKPAFREQIEHLAASREIDLEELHRRFIEGGYGGVDRYDRNISLQRFEQHASGETGALNQAFLWGLEGVLGLTEEEVMDFLWLYLWGVPRPAQLRQA